jgi:chemotaxis protein MotB
MTRRMAPRASLPIRASGDRWLFGYADVVTLLFACFASLYAAEVAPGRRTTAQADIPLPIEAPVPVPPPAPQAPAIVLPDAIATAVADWPARVGVDVAATERGVVISLAEAGTFAPGRADLTADARAALHALADLLRTMPNGVRVEGHTDDVPIRTDTFESNWELSTARATRVVQWLVEEGGVDASRLAAAGYAEHRPRVPNDGAAGRARNRRVDIVVLEERAALEEAPASVVR